MARFLSEGSVSFGGVTYASIDGVVEVPTEAVSVLMDHGLKPFVEPEISGASEEGGDDESEKLPEKRRGRPPKVREVPPA